MDKMFELHKRVHNLALNNNFDEKVIIPKLRSMIRRRIKKIYDIERKSVYIKHGKIYVYFDGGEFIGYKQYIPENEKSLEVQNEIAALIKHMYILTDNILTDNKRALFFP